AGSENQHVFGQGRAVDRTLDAKHHSVELLIVPNMGAADHALRAPAEIALAALALSRGPAHPTVIVAEAVADLTADIETGPGEGGQRRRGRGDRQQPWSGRRPL